MQTVSKEKNFSKLSRWLMGAAAAVLLAGTAAGQTITPITWNVVGLDSNNVTVGPNVFPIGARICNNTGSATSATTWQAKFNWVSTSSFITLTSPSVLPVPSLSPGACQDVFHEVTVSRNSAAYDQKAQYNIEVVNSSSAPLATPVKTPSNREIYVERLISQNRNAVTGISVDGTAVTLGSGSVSLNEGQIYTIRLDGKTATQGYEQLEQFLGLSSDLFVVKSVSSTFSASAGTDALASTKIYADGCGWQNDITATSGGVWEYHNNLSCSGTGKYGGVTSITYVVQVKTGAAAAAPSGRTTNALLYDFSGSSYHYNSDFATSAITFNFATTPPPTQIDLAIAKTAALVSPGNGTFTLSVTNASAITATGVTVVDSLPNGYNLKNPSSQPAAPSGTTVSWVTNNPEGVTWNIGSLGAGQTISYTFEVQTVNNQTVYVNQACVSGNETDPNSSNNCATAQVPEALADLAISKVANNFSATPLKVGDTLRFQVNLVNLGPSAATGVVVSDTVPAGYGSVTATCAVGTLSQSGSTYSCTVGNVAVGTTPTTVLNINATVLTTADPTVLTGYQNTATVTSTSNDPVTANNSASAAQPPTFLTIAKTASSASFITGSSTGTYTLTVTKNGTLADLGTVTVTDSLPPGVALTGYSSAAGWTCSPSSFPSSSAINCTRADDRLSGTLPLAYPDIVLAVEFSGPTAPVLTNRALVSSIKNGVVTSYAETSVNVSWTNSVTYYTVVATSSNASQGSASCTPSPVTSGASSVCTAVPAPGYVFSGWSGDCTGTVTTCSLSNITSNKTSVATFTLAPTYTALATVAAGTGTASCVPSTVSAGGSTVCTATAGSGWTFTSWTGACAGQTAACTLTNVNANVASQATFVIVTNPATATVSAGTGTAICVPATVDFGGTTVCTATPGNGWTFTGWTGACAGQGAVCTLTNVTAPVNSAASFVANTPAPIPTLSEWAMIFLASLMGMFAWLRKRNHAGLR
jgi:uncharacterized repeat protein (TIGR01451 family)/uncharacterized repeat protein (TIGR02543 family)